MSTTLVVFAVVMLTLNVVVAVAIVCTVRRWDRESKERREAFRRRHRNDFRGEVDDWNL